MKRIILTLCAVFCTTLLVTAAPQKSSGMGEPKALYDLLDLTLPGMEHVQKAVDKGDFKAADKELLKYYRNRTGITLTEIDLDKVTIKKDEQRWADESLEHKFYAHKGYQPSYFYGDDIDWRYWPVKDNELRWQLHRHYWFVPLTKAYSITKDVKYIDAWIDQFTDWAKKNPIDGVERVQAAGGSKEQIAAEKENFRFAWRPMEASHRLQNLPVEFALTVASPRFTPEFLNLFLQLCHTHADRILHNYSKQGNHLLFEAQRMIFAGIYFPEFKEAATWRKSGIDILNREIGVQVYPDGMQFELDFGYHAAAIDIFLKALRMANANGLESEFPKSYVETVEKMTVATYNLLFPDYTNPMFGDCKQHDKASLTRQFSAWGKVFPGNEQLQWFATQGKKGVKPACNSNDLPNSGFYILRNGWDMASTAAIVKAGPPAFWHNQPDNGTFEYWRKGRNFFPDSGSYVYAGDKEVMAQRDWFRQTRVHNTLTLDNRNLDSTNSWLLLWRTDDKLTTVVTENPSYKDLTHRRAMFFTPDGLLVIADQVRGEAVGTVGAHFNLCPSKITFAKDGTLSTLFADGNNIRIKTSCSTPARITEEEGWVSTAYRKKETRPAYAVEAPKAAGQELVFITVIAPADDKAFEGSIAIVNKQTTTGDKFSFAVRVGTKTYELGYELE